MASKVNVTWLVVGSAILLAWSVGIDWTGEGGAVDALALLGLILGAALTWLVGLQRGRDLHWALGLAIILGCGTVVPVIFVLIALSPAPVAQGFIGYIFAGNVLPAVSIALIYYGLRHGAKQTPTAGSGP